MGTDPMGRSGYVVGPGGMTEMTGTELYALFISLGYSPNEASNMVIRSGLGNEIGADQTRALTPAVLAAGEVVCPPSAERAGKRLVEDLTHVGAYRDATMALRDPNAPLSEKAMATGVMFAATADVAANFLTGGGEGTALKVARKSSRKS